MKKNLILKDPWYLTWNKLDHEKKMFYGPQPTQILSLAKTFFFPLLYVKVISQFSNLLIFAKDLLK